MKTVKARLGVVVKDQKNNYWTLIRLSKASGIKSGVYRVGEVIDMDNGHVIDFLNQTSIAADNDSGALQQFENTYGPFIK